MLSDLVLNALLIGKKIFENLVRLAGPLFVILATTLISCVIVIHYRALIPFYTDYFSFTGILHLTFSTFMAFNIGFNYFMTIFTSPGYAPLGVSPSSSFLLHFLHFVNQTTDETEVERLKREPAPRRGEGFSRYCKICNPSFFCTRHVIVYEEFVGKIAKPPRAHHCHICKRCTLKMDHHCREYSICRV
jgi:palmitoyltransferase